MTFQLKANRKETENKTIRFPLPLVKEIEKAIEKAGLETGEFDAAQAIELTDKV